ncbi:MAG: DUF3239 domain-containing protein [Pirellulaceae bacterium]
MDMETIASNPTKVKVELLPFLRSEMIIFLVTAVFLLVVFGSLGMFVWKWLWAGMLLWPIFVGLVYYGDTRIMRFGNCCPAKVISLKPDRLAIWTDMSMRPDASHPAVVVEEISLKRLTGAPVRIGERLAVSAFYQDGDEKLPEERWRKLTINPVRAMTSKMQDIARTLKSIDDQEWRQLEEGLQSLGEAPEPDVYYLNEGRKLGGAGVSEGRVMLVDGDDEAMKKAASFARKTFRFFIREWSWEQRRIVPGLDIAAVKIAFSDPPEIRSKNPADLEVEYMWVNDVQFDGQTLCGTLLNKPDSLKSVTEGDLVTVPGNRIVDWLYSVAGEVCGGFTIQLLRSQMSKTELRKHDKAWGLDFGLPGAVKLVPENYLPDDVHATRTRLPGLEKVFIQGDFKQIEQLEHPMSINMREMLETTLTENRDMLNFVDDQGLPFLHGLVVAGSLDGVDVALRKGANPHQKAANGLTPWKLARGLGWKKS